MSDDSMPDDHDEMLPSTLQRQRRGALQGLRDANLQRILGVIGSQGGLSQAEVARRTDLSPATVSNLVGELRQRGLVRTRDGGPGGHRALEIVPARHGAVVGIDYGYRHVRVGVADLAERLLVDEEHPLPLDFDAGKSCAEAQSMMDHLLATAGLRPGDVVQAAIGLPAPIDAVSGHIGWHGIPHRWVDADPRAHLEKAFGIPVVIDNDCNLGALGELRHGAGRDCADFIYISVTSGVGAGFVLDGRLYHGAAGTAGEISHLIVDPNGDNCRCGNRGCLDTVVGADGFVRLLRHVYGDALDVPQIIDLARQGDARCRRALAHAGRALGAVVTDLCNLLNPRRVIVAGPIFSADTMILGPLRETVDTQAVPVAARTVEIVRSELNERAEMLGAISLALDVARARATGNALARGATAG
jgi:predicted NBD/HSP70 family sugar kinase/DNA-binding CsgD family transcriptional regulator